jgi:putative hydrolases of HD superfamily
MVDLLAFFHDLEKLKLEKRAGWGLFNIEFAESVADHSFRVALMSFVLAREEGLDAEKAAVMGLVHDVAEAHAGDVASRHNEKDQEVTNEEKKKRELEGLKKLFVHLDTSVKDELHSLWESAEDKKTPEGELVKDVDRLEMCFQAVEYEKRYNKKLDEFFTYTEARLTHPAVKKLFSELIKERLGP